MRVLSNTPRPLVVFEAWIRAREYQEKNGGPLLIIDQHGDPVLYKSGKKKGEPKQFRLVIVAPGGGISCVVPAGMLQVLAARGYTNDAIGYLTVSGGLANTLGFASGRADKVIPFYEDLATPDFVKFYRIWNPRMLLEERVIEPMLAMLDLEPLRAFTAPIYTVLTEWETGTGYVVRVKVEEPPSQWKKVVQAAMTIPRMSPPVELTGIIPDDPHRKALFCDGASSKPLPLGDAVKILRPSHILVLAARPDQKELPQMEALTLAWLAQLGLLGVPAATKKGTLTMDDGTDRALLRMHKIHPRIECTAVIPKASSSIALFPFWPFTELNRGIVHTGGERGKELMEECLLHAQMAVDRHRDE